MSLTTDKNDPNLKKTKENGQQESYVVLSEEERAKGFVRPVRNSYVHIGRNYNGTDVVVLDEPYQPDNGKTYFATYVTLRNEAGKAIGWGYLTGPQLDEYYDNEGFVGGCGTLTEMGRPIAETYAREPSYYGSTFCVGCKKHIDVNEFTWEGTNEKVGS